MNSKVHIVAQRLLSIIVEILQTDGATILL